MIFSMILATNPQAIIGTNGTQPFHSAMDFAWFKEKTKGKMVVMGHSTFKDIKKPLKDRLNVVLTRDESLQIEDVMVFNSLSQVLEFAIATNQEEVVFIGGKHIYEQVEPFVSKIYLTTYSNYLEDPFNITLYSPNLSQFRSIESKDYIRDIDSVTGEKLEMSMNTYVRY